MRFRRRVTLIPGLRINVSGSGLSLSGGPRGAGLTFGKRGIYSNLSIPGTGLYQRTRLDGGRGIGTRGQDRPQLQQEAVATLAASKLRLIIPLDGGDVVLSGSDGSAIPEDLQALAWKLLGDSIQSQVEEACKRVSEVTDALTHIHLDTPPPSPPLVYRHRPFSEPAPLEPRSDAYHWFLRLFGAHRSAVDRRNIERAKEYAQKLNDWEARRVVHERRQSEIKSLFDKRASGTADAVEQFLVWRLSEIDWPKETRVDVDLSNDASALALDVDLPEVEDFPSGSPETVSKGRRIKWRPLTESAKRKLYASHIHGVLFRIIGEAFSACPSVGTIIVSGYSQRPDPGTGSIRDDYLVSVLTHRNDWSALNLASLRDLDPTEALGRFDTRRSMTKTGVFKPIQPHAPSWVPATSISS